MVVLNVTEVYRIFVFGGKGSSYMDRYHSKSSSNGFAADGLGKGDKGYSLLPNKYPSSHGGGGGGSSTNGELPNLSSAYSQHSNIHSLQGDFNSNLWSGHEDYYGNSTNGSSKGFKGMSNGNQSGKGRFGGNAMDKYSETSSRRFDTFSQNNTSIDQSDSDHEPFSSTFRPSYQNHGSGEGHFIKINREYDDMMMTDDGKKDGLDSAGSTNTRDSGVSSLKSSKTVI